jgi:hypothetical protein
MSHSFIHGGYLSYLSLKEAFNPLYPTNILQIPGQSSFSVKLLLVPSHPKSELLLPMCKVSLSFTHTAALLSQNYLTILCKSWYFLSSLLLHPKQMGGASREPMEQLVGKGTSCDLHLQSPKATDWLKLSLPIS